MAVQTADHRTGGAVTTVGALILAVAAILAGCVQQRPPAPPGQTARTVPGMGFYLARDQDEGWKLAYGQANSDNVQLMLECKPGSRKIDLFDMGHAKTHNGAILTLRSGQVQSALMASVEPDEASSDGAVVVAHTTPDLPALDGFRHSGALTVKVGTREYAVTANPGEKAEIARFFSGCERK